MVTAAQIRAVRKALNETQAEFGTRFGVDQSTIHRWEAVGPPTRGSAVVLIRQQIDALTAPPVVGGV